MADTAMNLVHRLLSYQPDSADWNRLLAELAASRVTDEAIVRSGGGPVGEANDRERKRDVGISFLQ